MFAKEPDTPSPQSNTEKRKYMSNEKSNIWDLVGMLLFLCDNSSDHASKTEQ